MDKLEKYANGWSKTEMDAFNIVMTDPAMPDYKSPDYDDWLFHKAWQAALAAAPTPAAIPLETLVAEIESDPEMKVALNKARKKDMLEGATVTDITPAQDEPVGELVGCHDGYGTRIVPEAPYRVNQQPDKLRKAAEALICAYDNHEHCITEIGDLRAALEGNKGNGQALD